MAGGLHPPLEEIETWPFPNYVNPHTRGYNLVILCAILGFFSILTVSVRLWTRARVTNNFGVDDWIILAAMFPILGMAVAIGLASKVYYFDRHVWDVPIPNGITDSRKITLVIELLYVWGVGLIKISILLFYKRLSAGILPKAVVYILWLIIAFVICFIFTFTMTIFVGCQPFSAYWQQVNPFWTASHHYTCIPDATALFVASIISVVQDFLVAGLPTLMFARMDLPYRQKLALAAVFAVGFFLCVTGILRIVYIYRIFYSTYDVTWQAHEAWQWTAIEGLLGTIVASAPSLKIFFQRHLESMSGGTWSYNASHSADCRWSHHLHGFPARVSRRFSGGSAWAWNRTGSDAEMQGGPSGFGPAFALARVDERPSHEKDGRESPMLKARRITAEDVRQEEELARGQRQRERKSSVKDDDIGVSSTQRTLLAHPSTSGPISPVSTEGTLTQDRATWVSAPSDVSHSMTSGVSSTTEEGAGFDPDAHALPILTEQEALEMGIGVAR